MTKEADFAFRQSFALCPSSPVVLFRYINLLNSLGRVDDSIRLAEAAIKISPGENQLSPSESQLKNLLSELQRLKRTQGGKLHESGLILH